MYLEYIYGIVCSGVPYRTKAEHIAWFHLDFEGIHPLYIKLNRD